MIDISTKLEWLASEIEKVEISSVYNSLHCIQEILIELNEKKDK